MSKKQQSRENSDEIQMYNPKNYSPVVLATSWRILEFTAGTIFCGGGGSKASYVLAKLLLLEISK